MTKKSVQLVKKSRGGKEDEAGSVRRTRDGEARKPTERGGSNTHSNVLDKRKMSSRCQEGQIYAPSRAYAKMETGG